MNKSLLGSLAERFVTQKENLASEALNIILNRSSQANEAFCKSVNEFENRLEGRLKFTTQVHSTDDNAIPDLIGYDSNSLPVCIVEAKFWASLTKNQPETYISRLDIEKPSVLVFLAPQARKYSLYMELVSRLKEAKIPFNEIEDLNGQRIELNSNNSIFILTWGPVLENIRKSVDEGSEIESDIKQLIGLCSSIDTNSFKPFSAEEISPVYGKRNSDLCDLVDEVVNYGKRLQAFSTKGLNRGASKYIYHRYFTFGNYNCKIKFDSKLWFTKANTPLWLEIFGKDDDGNWNNPKTHMAINNMLSELENESPPRLYNIIGSPPLIPLYVKSKLNKDKLLEDLFDQIMSLKKHLQ